MCTIDLKDENQKGYIFIFSWSNQELFLICCVNVMLGLNLELYV